MDNAGTLLADYWMTRGVQFLPGVDEKTIAKFEQKSGVRLPSEIRAYLKIMDGNVDLSQSSDRDGYGIWPLRMWVADHPACGQLITFGDYREEAFYYGLYVSKKTAKSWIVTLGTKRPLLAAVDFVEFARLVIADSPRLWDTPDARSYTAMHGDAFDFYLNDEERKRLFNPSASKLDMTRSL